MSITPTPTGGQVELKRYYFGIPINDASGHQCFYADAASEEEAREKINKGEGGIDAELCEVEVTSLNKDAAFFIDACSIPPAKPDLLRENEELRGSLVRLGNEKNTAVNKWVARLKDTERERDSLRAEVERFQAALTAANQNVAEQNAELARLREEMPPLLEALRVEYEKVKAERDTLRATNAGLVEALGIADKMILHHCNPEDPCVFRGDWACAECRPDSEIIKPGFRCAFHEAKDRQDSAFAKALDAAKGAAK